MTALGYTALIIAALLVGAAGGFVAARVTRRYRRTRPEGPTVAELLQRLVHTGDSGVVVLNKFGDVVLHNPRADELGLVRDHQADPRARKAAEQALLTGEPVPVDLSPLNRAGTALRGRGPAAVLGEVRPLGNGFAAVDAADESDSVRLEATRRDFVANVSHELKTPVGALALLAEAVLDAADDVEEVRRFSTKILHESTRLGTLVSELIALSRLQGAERLPELTTVDVDAVVEEALGRCRLAAESAGIEITLDEPTGYLLDGDRTLLVTALSNLIDNAVSYSPPGSPVSISRRLSSDFVEIAVTDRGIGIEPDFHERVFERFFRVDPARSRATGGTGLGLAIVKHVAANHGGEVKLWSRPGTGSTFTLRVPRHGGPNDGQPAAEPASSVDRAGSIARSGTESADGVITVETGGVR
ncbi:sensor histidine kinase [Saccharopolyspora phatthalungensis]|uniref:Sensor-like histidine kinase SenX3 n=1 Tax=Saccharopolyspora phatthalungensis TaxID=664693 RepID=A0A840Q3Q8_9PSEU|nr:ATP-binding protein [Saccharopolyspora phatthalungensis]MBB5154617.1 two-component system sensor histidine kinase SenX3 [Saccharopolyspora phatthalungensis]